VTPANAAAADEALRALAAAVERLDEAAERAGGWWSRLIGAESTAAAARTNAAAARSFYQTMLAKRARLATDEDVADFVASIRPVLDTRDQERIGDLLTPGGALRDVGGATFEDVKAGLSIGLPVVGLLLVVGVVLYAGLLAGGRR
jgi:hypothetical protein